jgi:small conductance mechanosensitive channel
MVTSPIILWKFRRALTFAILWFRYQKAKDLILSILNENPTSNTPPEVFVKNLTDSAIELAVRPWAKAKTMVLFYWNIRKLQNSFDAAGIVIQPYLKEMSAIKTTYYTFFSGYHKIFQIGSK